jgi:hypothetical protein
MQIEIIHSSLNGALLKNWSKERIGRIDDMGWPDLLSKLAVMVMMVIDNLVSPMISPR